MTQRVCGTICAVLIWAGPGWAQTPPWQFHWQKGQTVTYQTEHVTKIEETADGSTIESTAKVQLIKRWQVMDVDDRSVATLRLTLAAMRNEQTRTGRPSLVFDSENLEKSSPELKEQLSKFVGQPLALIRIDPLGRIHEVKLGSAARLEAEPPFVFLLPATAPKEGQAWARTYRFTTDDKSASGTTFEASQRYHCRKIEAGKATVALTTEIKNLPESAGEQVPLLQRMGEGEAVFDIPSGRLHAVRLHIDRTLENHQGAGSRYRFQSTFTEQLMDGK